jgi:hypothetical protein
MMNPFEQDLVAGNFRSVNQGKTDRLVGDYPLLLDGWKSLRYPSCQSSQTQSCSERCDRLGTGLFAPIRGCNAGVAESEMPPLNDVAAKSRRFQRFAANPFTAGGQDERPFI